MSVTVQGLIELARAAAGEDRRAQERWLLDRAKGIGHEPTLIALQTAVSVVRLRIWLEACRG